MQIREVEQSAGLPAKTIRYYEEIGLVRPNRQDNGYRIYSTEDVHRLRFLQRARGLGFSIEDCRALLSLYDETGRESADVRAIAEAHLDEIDRKIRELKGMRQTLAHLVHACHGDDRPDCPILDDLAGIGDGT
ncbi:Cu(I)-responsive transcriptional regulator [uncultured Nisaea sp.]|jgi:MerR family transcriptional regulator, copper efflux regulator|uniref:Cu(I)-responsive transcriptional regulator n=1 Tax=uncultured Nisaea sp. TaxID=538215 RepID=UPI0030EE476B|tara:strand:- start:174 stop:572 length:399 start_codon:yes stop_codon:yes gene_type:complete